MKINRKFFLLLMISCIAPNISYACEKREDESILSKKVSLPLEGSNLLIDGWTMLPSENPQGRKAEVVNIDPDGAEEVKVEEGSKATEEESLNHSSDVKPSHLIEIEKLRALLEEAKQAKSKQKKELKELRKFKRQVTQKASAKEQETASQIERLEKELEQKEVLKRQENERATQKKEALKNQLRNLSSQLSLKEQEHRLVQANNERLSSQIEELQQTLNRITSDNEVLRGKNSIAEANYQNEKRSKDQLTSQVAQLSSRASTAESQLSNARNELASLNKKARNLVWTHITIRSGRVNGYCYLSPEIRAALGQVLDLSAVIFNPAPKLEPK